ncbi:glycosyltransferase family 39 protein [Persephonella sp.]
MVSEKKIWFLILLGILSFFPNINVYEFRGEESLRVIVAYEMVSSQNYLQPTFLGDLYFNKPPLFNWLIAVSSYFIPWSELTGRIVSILSVFATVIVLYLFALKLTKSRETALLSALFYLVALDILFWYGYLAEIDATLALFILIMFYFQIFGFLEKKNLFILASGITAGLAFLLKGFPAYVFFGLTYLSLVVFKKEWKFLLNKYFIFSIFTALVLPLLWIINTADPQFYIKKLFIESIVRAEGSSDLINLLKHFIEYPLLNFKQMIPASLIALAVVLTVRLKNRKASFNIPENIKMLIIISAVNYLPYILSVNSRGRYVIPLFTLMAVVIAYLIVNTGREKWIKISVYTAVFFIMVRFAVGIIGFPVLMEKKASRKKVAYTVAQMIDISRKIACDCRSEKTVCLYLDFLKGSPLKTSKHIPDWDYLIDCSYRYTGSGSVLKEFDLKGKKIFLIQR